MYQAMRAGFELLMLAVLVAGLVLPSRWRLVGAVLPMTYVSTLSMAGMNVTIRQGVLIGLLFPFAVAMIQLH